MDRLTKEQRSRNMASVRGKDTKPELRVRSAVHRNGFRYSLHCKDLPGKPDLALPKYNTVIFVHGCFWHGHDCSKGKRPATNKGFWQEKLDSNVERDRRNQAALAESGWRVLVVWECEIEEGIDRAVGYLQERRSGMAEHLRETAQFSRPAIRSRKPSNPG